MCIVSHTVYSSLRPDRRIGGLSGVVLDGEGTVVRGVFFPGYIPSLRKSH